MTPLKPSIGVAAESPRIKYQDIRHQQVPVSTWLLRRVKEVVVPKPTIGKIEEVRASFNHKLPGADSASEDSPN